MAKIVQNSKQVQKPAPGAGGVAYVPDPSPAKRPTAAFALILAGGIIVLIAAIVVMVVGFAAISYINHLPSNATTIGNTSIALNATVRAQISGASGTIYLDGTIGIITGIVLVALSLMVRKTTNLKKMRNLSIAALAVSIISYFGGGGLLIGMALGIIGSVLGLIYKG
jgi:hypothetical protein